MGNERLYPVRGAGSALPPAQNQPSTQDMPVAVFTSSVVCLLPVRADKPGCNWLVLAMA